MRPRNCLAYRLALPLAIVVGPAPLAGAAPIVPHTAVPAGESPGPSVSRPKEVGKGAPVSRRPGNGSALAVIAAPRSPGVPRRRESSDFGPWRSVRSPGDGRGERGEGRPAPDQAASAPQDLPTGGLLLLPLPPNPEPGEVRTYVGEPSGTTGAAAGEVASPIGVHDAVPLPRGPEEVSTPRSSGHFLASGHPRRECPRRAYAGGPGEPSPPPRRTPRTWGRATPPRSRTLPRRRRDGLAGHRRTGRRQPERRELPGRILRRRLRREGLGWRRPCPADRGPRRAGPSATSRRSGPSRSPTPPSEPAPPVQNPGGAKPTGIATGAGAAGRSTGVPSDSQTSAVANTPGPVSGGSGGTINEAAQGTGGMSSMDQANAFGQMLTTAVLAQELTSPGRTGAGGSHRLNHPPISRSLAMSDRALLAEVGGTTPLDANPGASGDVGGGRRRPRCRHDAASGPERAPRPRPPLAGGRGRRGSPAGRGTGRDVRHAPESLDLARAIPEPTPLMQLVVVLAGSAFVIARRRVQGDAVPPVRGPSRRVRVDSGRRQESLVLRAGTGRSRWP